MNGCLNRCFKFVHSIYESYALIDDQKFNTVIGINLYSALGCNHRAIVGMTETHLFPFMQVDAFTDRPLAENPYAIRFDADLDDLTMSK